MQPVLRSRSREHLVVSGVLEGGVVVTAGATVLLVDDDPMVCRGFARLLEATGYRTVVAHSGENGLEILNRRQPEAVLLDLNMPGLGGLETLTRAVERAPDTPIIVVSGSG